MVFRVREPPILSRALNFLVSSLSPNPSLSFSLTPNPSCPLLLSLSSEHGSWVPFDPVGEQAVETAHAAGHSSAQSSFFNPRLQQNIVYQYDLTQMQQVKTTNDCWTDHVLFLRANLCLAVWLCAFVDSLSSK